MLTGKQAMPQPTQMDIVRRAYELWEQAGKPELKSIPRRLEKVRKQ